jgi:hypothetical protein
MDSRSNPIQKIERAIKDDVLQYATFIGLDTQAVNVTISTKMESNMPQRSNICVVYQGTTLIDSDIVPEVYAALDAIEQGKNRQHEIDSWVRFFDIDGIQATVEGSEVVFNDGARVPFQGWKQHLYLKVVDNLTVDKPSWRDSLVTILGKEFVDACANEHIYILHWVLRSVTKQTWESDVVPVFRKNTGSATTTTLNTPSPGIIPPVHPDDLPKIVSTVIPTAFRAMLTSVQTMPNDLRDLNNFIQNIFHFALHLPHQAPNCPGCPAIQ